MYFVVTSCGQLACNLHVGDVAPGQTYYWATLFANGRNDNTIQYNKRIQKATIRLKH